ncbi:M81 family metallopeptidase [Massilibacteroides vaginae]|uniref:M81 family metallopeptidase n=1 Tax=Massilibacteroides vaginae TaxID=1673718 RepID=UPI000A1C9FF1|nr:M81 family metallopeptidase [Massilibacteroides vaginae]
MKKSILFLLTCLLSVPLGSHVMAQKKPRIGIAGIQIENSVFMPNRQAMVGNPIYMPDYLNPDSTLGKAATWFPTLMGRGSGRGPVTRESYNEFVDKTLEMIKENMPYDAFWFYMHGACSVEGVEDPEGEFMEKIRQIIGNDILTTTTMDLHGNPSLKVALNSDLITTYRKAPHDDSRESHRRGVVNLLERISSGKGRPAYKAWVAVPVLVSGEWSSTRVEPAKSLYALVPEVEAMPGVIDAGIWIGYVWGDDRRNQGVVMVYGDDKEQVGAGAKKLAQKFWDVRDQFSLEAPGYPLEKCLDLAIASDKKPFFISDMGDNPGGGGSGEVTWTLARVLKRPEFQSPNGKSLLYCSIPGEEMVKAARKVGVGGQAEAYVGAMTDNAYEPPVLLSGTVVYVSPEQDQASQSSTPYGRRQSDIAIIKTGSVYVVVGTSSPTPPLENTGVDPREMDIVMPKQGYLVNQWYNMKADWVMALTRGGVDQDFKSVPYKNIIRPMYPIDKDNMPEPELNVIFVPSAKHLYGR